MEVNSLNWKEPRHLTKITLELVRVPPPPLGRVAISPNALVRIKAQGAGGGAHVTMLKHPGSWVQAPGPHQKLCRW